MNTDIIVIGGGPAGLQAALTIGRVHRRAVVFDDGTYRNRAVTHMHNVIGNDGTPPEEFRATARDQLAAYATIEVRRERVARVEPHEAGWRVRTDDDAEVTARAVVLATGVRDELPEIPGLVDLWGDLAAACPFCHGHEYAGRTVGIVGAERAGHLATLLGPIAGDLLVLTDGAIAPDGLAEGIQIVTDNVLRVERTTDGRVAAHLDGGRVVTVDGLFVSTTLHQSAPFAEQLGLELNASGCVRIDELGRTSVAGVFAAGDLAHVPAMPMPMTSVVAASAAGQFAASAALASVI